ncbi:IS3 family transposase [Streptomyces sp. S1D4-11]|nr:IS3 family transposase [Streptomyces sp. S1D4-11]
MDLPVSAYNARGRRPKSARRLREEQKPAKIRAASGETFGARRIHRRLRREGVTAASCTIERLMRENDLGGASSAAGDDAPRCPSRPLPGARSCPWEVRGAGSSGVSPPPRRETPATCAVGREDGA